MTPTYTLATTASRGSPRATCMTTHTSPSVRSSGVVGHAASNSPRRAMQTVGALTQGYNVT